MRTPVDQRKDIANETASDRARSKNSSNKASKAQNTTVSPTSQSSANNIFASVNNTSLGLILGHIQNALSHINSTFNHFEKHYLSKENIMVKYFLVSTRVDQL